MRATWLSSGVLLSIIVGYAVGQYHDSPNAAENFRQKGHFTPIQIRNGRFQSKPQLNRPTPQSIILNQSKLRKPLPFRPLGPPASIDEPNDSILHSAPSGPSLDGPKPSSPISELKKPLPFRPSLPSPIYIHSQNVKPVNEDSEEDRSQEHIRSRHHNTQGSQEDDDFSSREQEVQNDSDESVSRVLGSISSSTPLPLKSPIGNLVTNSYTQPIHYRPFPEVPPTFVRGPQLNSVTPPPSPQYRPSPKPTKPRKILQEEPIRQQIKQPIKPGKPTQIYDSRGKKPVAQIIRRYRNDNEDGSITWGFENDDGSYKEEIIGIDCITRGKYGYIDPDGIRREYTYETGIKCDEEQREEEEESGFVDYQENKLVLPDGKTIDLSSMGKKQARRPGPVYRN